MAKEIQSPPIDSKWDVDSYTESDFESYVPKLPNLDAVKTPSELTETQMLYFRDCQLTSAIMEGPKDKRSTF